MELTDEFHTLIGEQGRVLLSAHLAGDLEARSRLGTILDAACEGALDDDFKADPKPDHVHVTTSAHLLTLAVMNRYDGMRSSEFYKADPLRYARLNLLIQRLVGIESLTLGTPVYGFGAESLGQVMMYPDDQAPGSDPGHPLVAIDAWEDIPDYDPNHPVTRVVRETAVLAAQLAGTEPVVHLPAPYSFAAEIFGQEYLINALNTEPDTVHALLAHLTRKVLLPWCADLAAQVPDVWLELSDASGSPMFIGPDNFVSFTVGPVRQLIDQPGWGERVFVANYRGDSPPRQASRGRRRNAAPDQIALSFENILAAKVECCPIFLTRLEADAASESTYADAAIELGIPLYLGIGAVRLDRNSTTDRESALIELYDTALDRATVIQRVRSAIGVRDGAAASRSWPGDLYIEDTNGETDLGLLAAVLEGCAAAQPVPERA